MRVKDAEHQQGSAARGRALTGEKRSLQVVRERAEGHAEEGQVGHRGAGCRGEPGKTEVKGDEAFHVKTCKKQPNAGALLHPPFSFLYSRKSRGAE